MRNKTGRATADLSICAQGVLQQLLDMGVVGGLPEDLQWTIRMLLPKPPPCALSLSTPPVAYTLSTD